jgi:hypothetical protein
MHELDDMARLHEYVRHDSAAVTTNDFVVLSEVSLKPVSTHP